MTGLFVILSSDMALPLTVKRFLFYDRFYCDLFRLSLLLEAINLPCLNEYRSIANTSFDEFTRKKTHTQKKVTQHREKSFGFTVQQRADFRRISYEINKPTERGLTIERPLQRRSTTTSNHFSEKTPLQ